jgi:hypothetical protein
MRRKHSSVSVLFVTASLAASLSAGAAVSCTENFDDVGVLVSQGWIIKNNSDPLGTTNWFQGIAARFPAQAGADASYVSADSDNASGQFPVLSDWLITPDIAFAAGNSLSFYTRDLAGAGDEANHMQVLLCVDGIAQTCADPGDESGAVGGFQTFLVDINADAVAGGYPANWTQITANAAMGMPQSGTGRIAFHYYDLAQQSDIGTTIGLDTVTLSQVAVCPFTDVVFANAFEGQ